MGASTALLHADRDPSIAGLVLDSPFSDLKVLCEELVDVYTNGKIPRWVVGIALQMVRGSIKQHAHFDIYELAPIQHVSRSFIPALFTAAYNDNFIRPHHAKELHEAYAGDKNFVMVEGDHNSARCKFFMDSVAIFFFNTLQCDQLPHERLAPALQRHLLQPSASSAVDPEVEQALQHEEQQFLAGAAGSAADRTGDDRRAPKQQQQQQQGQQQGLGLQMRPPDRM
jgi:hypothetical protein